MPEPTAPQSPIDLARLDSVCPGDRREADAMLRGFLAAMPAYRSTIEKAVSAGDLATLAHAAHRFKGTVSMLGARPLAGALARLQKAAEAGALETAEHAAAEAFAEWDRLFAFLQALRE